MVSTSFLYLSKLLPQIKHLLFFCNQSLLLPSYRWVPLRWLNQGFLMYVADPHGTSKVVCDLFVFNWLDCHIVLLRHHGLDHIRIVFFSVAGCLSTPLRIRKHVTFWDNLQIMLLLLVQQHGSRLGWRLGVVRVWLAMLIRLSRRCNTVHDS